MSDENETEQHAKTQALGQKLTAKLLQRVVQGEVGLIEAAMVWKQVAAIVVLNKHGKHMTNTAVQLRTSRRSLRELVKCDGQWIELESVAGSWGADPSPEGAATEANDDG